MRDVLHILAVNILLMTTRILLVIHILPVEEMRKSRLKSTSVMLEQGNQCDHGMSYDSGRPTAIKRIFGAKDSAACLLSLKSFESIKFSLLMSTMFMARKQIQWSTSSTGNKTVDVQFDLNCCLSCHNKQWK